MTTLEDLYIYYCRRCDCKPNTKLCSELKEAYEAAGNQRYLTALNLSQNYVGPKGIAPVLELARNIHSLTVLDLRNNMLEHDELEMLVKALAKHPSITKVDLSNNQLHDASLENILLLLKVNPNIVEFRLAGNDFFASSLDRVDEQLLQNHAVKREEMARRAELEAQRAAKFLPHKSSTAGELTTVNSGGHFHFASWRKNPQFQMYLSTKALVTISIKIQDPNPTKQFGFAVMKGKGLIKVIEYQPEDILVESPFHHEIAKVSIRLEAANRTRCEGPYIIVPFSFNPQRSCKFDLECEIVDEPGTQSLVEAGAFISVEPLDSRYDWAVQEINGVWSTDNAGGCLAYPSWRDNVMYHLQFKGTAAARQVATLFFVLTKSNDNDVNDNRSIGMYIVSKNARGPGAPLVINSENLVKVVEHSRSTSVTLRFEASCGSMDWYVIPTTDTPGSFGEYTLTVFSTCVLAPLTPVHHPHGWAYHTFDGVWDESKNGGCRKDNVGSWVHNPSYMFHHEGENPMAVTISLEVLEAHNTDSLEAHLMLLQYSVPDFGPMKITDFSPKESVLTLNLLPKGTYVLVVCTRRAGAHGRYRVRAFTENVVFISTESTLAVRIRESQMAAYADENDRRREAVKKLLPPAAGTALPTPALQGVPPQYQDEFVAAVQEKEAAVKEYLASGTLYVDREFPRGVSSLWLGLDDAPDWAPSVVGWSRPTELVIDQSITFAPQWTVDQCVVGGMHDEWFLSAVGAISLKPDWLARVARSYDPEYGIAQFSFFKNGQWHAVTIDDYLPVDSLSELSFSKSHTRPNDFFIPLIEKAYAKFHRCYQALDRRVGRRLSLASHLREALMDLSGGLCWTYSISECSDNEDEQQRNNILGGESFWAMLKSCRDDDRIVSLCLASEAINSQEKQHVGLVRDRLYAVMDARAVEGVRLVQIRQFWTEEDAVRPFQGKWAMNSPNWTAVMQYAVDYKPNSSSFWMSADEAEYYFSAVYLTKKYKHATFIEGGFNPSHVGGPLQNDTWTENAQYALDIHRSPEEGAMTVTVGIHQPDSRSVLTRARDFELGYKTSIGFSIFLTDNNTRRLVRLNPNDYVVHSPVLEGRDCLLTLTIDPVANPTRQKLIVMPFQTAPKNALQCFVSVWNDFAPTGLALIQTSTRTLCEGEWRGGSSGGPPMSGTWRNNPQYFLYPSEGMEVTIVLRQRNDLSSTEEYIGFTVHRATTMRSILHYKEDDVVLSVPHENGHAVAGTVRLCGMSERRGMPYVIVPTCAKALAETGFTLEVIANKKVHLTKIPTETNWRSLVFPVSLKYTERNTGGSFRFSSWRNNPQFLLQFPYEKQGDLLVCVTNRSVSDETEVGVALIKADSWDHGRKRKVAITPKDILADSGEQCHSSELKTVVTVHGNEPLILMPYASLPFSEVNLTVSIYSAVDVELGTVQEWYSEVVEGSWELGLTAGGNRAANRTWVNNPFYSLSVTRQTRITAVLLQYPRGPEKPQVKRVGKHRTYLPPPITNPQNKISVGLDLIESNEDNSPITSTKHAYEGEVLIATVLPPCVTTPYFLVPHTFEPEQEADFKIMLFADQPFQFQEFKKVRRYF